MKKEINSTQHIYHSDWIKALKPYDQGDENTQKMVSKIEVDEIKLFESQLSLMLGESEMIDEMDKFGIFYAPIVYKDPRKNKEKITNFSFGSGDIKTTIEIEPVSEKIIGIYSNKYHGNFDYLQSNINNFDLEFLEYIIKKGNTSNEDEVALVIYKRFVSKKNKDINIDFVFSKIYHNSQDIDCIDFDKENLDKINNFREIRIFLWLKYNKIRYRKVGLSSNLQCTSLSSRKNAYYWQIF